MARAERNKDNQREETDLIDKLVGINRVRRLSKAAGASVLRRWWLLATDEAGLVSVR